MIINISQGIKTSVFVFTLMGFWRY